MRRRVATIDVGSNSVLCLVAETQDNKSGRIIADFATVTGLGRGLSRAGLHPASRQRTFEALERYHHELDALEVTECYAVATAAMRDAADGPDFVHQIEQALRIPVSIISGEREAELTWLSVANAFAELGAITVFDIGGRSTEVMLGDGARLQYRVSLPIGSVYGTERYLSGDPVEPSSLNALSAEVRQLLASLPVPDRAGFVVGVASTVTTFAAMHKQMAEYDGQRIHKSELSRATVQNLLQQMIRLPVAERRLIRGLEAKRADVIIAGGIILKECLEYGGSDTFYVSDHGLRHGLLYEMTSWSINS